MKKATFIFLIFGLLLLAATSYAPAQGSSITLQWAPSLSNGVVGYNIYRSKSSGSGYERLNTQLIIGTSFEDDTIQTGIDYYYVCRAVTIDGTESVNSNEAILVQADLNSAPEAADDTVQTQEDTPAIILPLANDYDGDDDPLHVTAVSDPAHGSASVISASEIRYTPDADFSGSDTMTYTVADPGGKTDTGTITVTVSPVNDPPTASADSATTNEDTAVEIDLLANDSDPDNDSLTVQILENPAHGTLQALTTGRYRYQPRENYFGSDSFSYRITDAGNSTAEASVSITVRSVNDAPIAVNDAFTTMEDNPATINLLANDSDVEGDALTVSITVQPANGSAVVLANGTVTYTPRPDYNGPDSFTYRVTDSGGAYGTALVSVTVAPGADVFRAMADSLSIVEDGTGVINLLSNDENPDSLSLTVSIQSQPMHGQVQVLSAGEISYTPAADYSGTDSFTYALSDPNGNTSVATVSISVSGVNDPPVAVADSITVDEDQSATVMLLANDFDAEGNTLSASLRSAPSNGRVTVSLNGEAVYTPDPDFSGSDSFFYEVSDGSALSTDRKSVV